MGNNYWKLMLEGDREMFLVIYKDNYQPLFRYGYSLCGDREMVKDSIQEIFLEIWTKRNAITKDVHEIRSYLFTWLRRNIMHKLSGLSKERSLIPEQNFIELSYEELLIAFQQTEEKKQKLQQALKRLTKKQIEIIRLRFFEELSYTDIADKTSLTTRTVYNVIYEAIQNLRNYMQLFFLIV